MEADPWLSESVGERLLWSNPLHFNCSFNIIFDGHSPQFGSAPCFPTHSVVICPESTFEHLWMWFSTLYLYILNSSLNLNYTHRATEVLRQYIFETLALYDVPSNQVFVEPIFHLLPNICEGNWSIACQQRLKPSVVLLRPELSCGVCVFFPCQCGVSGLVLGLTLPWRPQQLGLTPAPPGCDPKYTGESLMTISEWVDG